MMGVNAVLWSHMLFTEKNDDGRQKRQRGGEEEKSKRRELCDCVFVEKGAASSDVGIFFCPSHNLDFLDPLPTSEF
jgi:hypothetical protein